MQTMTIDTATRSTVDSTNAVSVPLIRLLSFVFLMSGFAALLYQVAWQRLLTTYYGVGAVSVTLIVSVYMLGLGFGALVGGFLAERVIARIRLYALVECAIASFGLISLPFLDFLGRHTAGNSHYISLACIALFLCVPTLLMGMTLPLVTKIFNHSIRNFLSTVSMLYFLNTMGAAFGALVGAYVIISFFGLDVAVYSAVAINFVLALLIFLAGRRVADQPAPESFSLPAEHEERGFGRIAYLLVFVTGFMAIGYEIVWFRLNEVLTKNSPYTFATVLFVYLLGIAIGSFAINRCWNRLQRFDKRHLFFAFQFFIGAYVATVVVAYFYGSPPN